MSIKFKHYIYALGTLLLAAGCSRSDLNSPSFDDSPLGIVDENLYSSRKVRIKVSESKAAELEKEGTLSLDGVVSLKRTFPYAGKFEARTRAEGMHLWYDVVIDESALNLTKANHRLLDIEGVQKVEFQPKRVSLQESHHFNDPYLGSQWHYDNDGLVPASKAGCDINVEKVWKEFTTGDPSVIVAIVDAGMETSHPDLKDNVWVNEAEQNGQPGVDDDNNGYIDDIYGYNFVKDRGEIVAHDHATHVAGTIGAVNNNGRGVCGIAGGDYKAGQKGVRLMSCEIVEIDATEEANIAAAIKYGADNGAVISQNSWSYLEGVNELNESDRLAIDYFVKYAGLDENGNQVGPMNGGIVIFAAGNENRTESYPAIYDKVVAVSAIDAAYTKTQYSNYGRWVDIAAPGGVVFMGQSIYSTVTMAGGAYGEKEGTSMACPHVSGVAALLVSYYGKEKGFNPYKLKNLLYSSAVNINDYNTYYRNQLGRLVNAYGAFTFSSEDAPKAIEEPVFSPLSNNVVCSWKVPYDPDERQAYSYGVFYSEQPFSSDFDRENLDKGIHYQEILNGDLKKGEDFEGMISGLEFNTEYYLAVDAADMFGNRSAVSEVKTVTTGDNHAPVIENPQLTFDLKSSETASQTIYYREPDLHRISAELKDAEEAITLQTFRDDSVKVTVNALRLAAGSHTATVVISDPYGMSAEAEISIRVAENNKPETVKGIDDIVMKADDQPLTFILSEYFSDKDGDELTFECSADNTKVISAGIENGILRIAPLNAGKAKVKVIARDARDAAELNFNVEVESPYIDPEDIDISAYPNPVTDYLYIVSNTSTSAKILLTSPLGQIVCDQVLELNAGTPLSIDLSERESGTYSLIITLEDKVITQNIMKL